MWINIIEDEKNLNYLIKKYLEEEGYKVRSYTLGEEARRDMNLEVDLWIIDIMLPDTNGFTLFREIKHHHPEVYTIFISARNQDIDRVAGLEIGSDDYISKPFMVRELIIKVNKMLKKEIAKKEYINISNYKIDLLGRRVSLGTLTIELTSKEFDVLLMFINNKGVSLSRNAILDRVWGMDYYGSERVVDDTVRRIRKKLEKLDVRSIYGHGYSYEGVFKDEG